MASHPMQQNGLPRSQATTTGIKEDVLTSVRLGACWRKRAAAGKCLVLREANFVVGEQVFSGKWN